MRNDHASEKTGCMWTEHGARGVVQHGNHNLAPAGCQQCDLFVTSNDEIDGLLDFFDEMAAAHQPLARRSKGTPYDDWRRRSRTAEGAWGKAQTHSTKCGRRRNRGMDSINADQ